MPCDSIQTQQISFKDAQGHEQLLAEALERLGYRVTIAGAYIQFVHPNGIRGSYANGQFCSQGYAQMDVDVVKREFATGAVKKAAKQYGWPIEDLGNNKFKIRKRRV